jgi:magnesium-transporting ATPase (P-type)
MAEPGVIETKPASYHELPGELVLARLASSPSGLPSAEAAARLSRHGPNVLPRASRKGPLALIWSQIKSPLIYVLIASGILAIALGKRTDGAVVLGVVVLNTLIGFLQEHRAERAIEALIDLVPESATALRDGEPVVVNAAELVTGDVVLLRSGDKVPADMRLLAVKNLRVEEASLTGESVPVSKHVEPAPGAASVADQRSMVFGGTLIATGTATAVVVATGLSTELGRISSMLREATELSTPLTRSMARVASVLTAGIGAVTAVIVVVAMLRGYAVVDALMAGISLAVAAIPEGLPAIITIALAVGVQRMARRRAVIRKLPAVETLGSTSVVCSDKTGTLTRNEMTVQGLWAPSGLYALSGVGYAPRGELSREGEAEPPQRDARVAPADVLALLRAGALCSDASLSARDGRYGVAGDPTEGALMVAAAKLGLELEALRRAFPRRDTIPFESEHRYMATLHDTPEGDQLIALKGAPEVVLARCAELADTTPIDRAALLSQVEALAERGMRVLAVAARAPSPRLEALTEGDVAGGFSLLGFEGMIDPPRPEAIEAVKACQEAGIVVKMITGDHHATAKAIGVELGLLPPEGAVLTGQELDALSDEALVTAAREVNVFARVSPEHKLRLVRALQASGDVVAMTGDGVNDAPALKQANIGVAMGITGTAASKEAADIVLADDNFASIRAAVEEGRRVYDNLVKALAFVLPTNLGEALVILVAVMMFPLVNGAPLMPIAPVQILWINLAATVTLSLPLAFEAMEPSVMARPPRSPEEPILSGFVLFRTAAVAILMAAGAVGLFLVEYSQQASAGAPGETAVREAQTMAVNTVVLFQVVYLLNCRSLRGSLRSIGLFSNPTVYVGIAALLLLQVGFVYLPFMNTLFGSAPLGVVDWLKSAAVALFVLPVIGLERWWRRRRAVRRAPGGGPPLGLPRPAPAR